MKLSLCMCFILLVLNLVYLEFSCGSVIISSALVAGGSIVVVWMWEPICWRLVLCCNNRLISTIVPGLKSFLEEKFYGPRLASLVICPHVELHVRYENSSKTFVLTLHGTEGVCKTFVSKAVAENIYEGGLWSKFVRLISATRDFPDRGDLLSANKNQLRARIEGNVSEYDQLLFIFEEGIKLPVGPVDVFVAFVECRSRHHHIKYSKAVFILLSNTDSSNTMKATFDHNRKTRKGRKSRNHSALKM